jgi:trans-o-hydroxybenzylidenepyruvate hydratase-aldolase
VKSNTLRITSKDINGAWAILPTPAKPGASDWRMSDTVDLDETARAVDALIELGIDGLLSLGTYGEAATLTWEEKLAFMGTVTETVRRRVPYFCGTTALHTREVIRQTRAAHDLGVSGTMLGVPMWCKADLPTAVQFYRDITEACPDTAICVYANTEAFKFEFSRPFWAQVGALPQVVAAKYLGIGQLMSDLNLTNSIRFLPHEGDYYPAARIAPDRCTAFWSSGALCGPAAVLALRDAVADARKTNDWAAAKEISDAIRRADATMLPNGDFAEFSKYNVGLEKERMNRAGWMRAGPCRPPYHLVPERYLEGARTSATAWQQLQAQYAASAPRPAGGLR